MTNKEYKKARMEAETVDELYTFESWNGFSIYPNRYMKPDDIKELREEYKELKNNDKAYSLKDFGNRALIIPNGNELILRSYYTDVCRYNLVTDTFTKTWNGFSVTTLKHINTFRSFLGMNTLSKREWIELETE